MAEVAWAELDQRTISVDSDDYVEEAAAGFSDGARLVADHYREFIGGHRLHEDFWQHGRTAALRNIAAYPDPREPARATEYHRLRRVVGSNTIPEFVVSLKIASTSACQSEANVHAINFLPIVVHNVAAAGRSVEAKIALMLRFNAELQRLVQRVCEMLAPPAADPPSGQPSPFSSQHQDLLKNVPVESLAWCFVHSLRFRFSPATDCLVVEFDVSFVCNKDAWADAVRRRMFAAQARAPTAQRPLSAPRALPAQQQDSSSSDPLRVGAAADSSEGGGGTSAQQLAPAVTYTGGSAVLGDVRTDIAGYNPNSIVSRAKHRAGKLMKKINDIADIIM